MPTNLYSVEHNREGPEIFLGPGPESSSWQVGPAALTESSSWAGGTGRRPGPDGHVAAGRSHRRSESESLSQ